jgi:hypothetical protein
MFRITLVIIFNLVKPFSVFSQSGDDFFTEKFFSLRTNPFSVFEKDGGLMLGANYRWNSRWSATIDPAFVFFTIHANLNGLPNDRPLGVRVKTDIRYHIPHFILGFTNVFIAPEATFARIRTRKTAVFGINCNGPNCDYYRQEVYTENKKETGAAIKLGLTRPIWKHRDNWKFELFIGMGVSFYDFRKKGIPTGGSFVNLPVYMDNLGNVREEGPNIMLPAGLKIVYLLK